jgi:predicted phosphodiesterase
MLAPECSYNTSENVVMWTWYGVSRTDSFRIIPLGDMHLGNEAAERHEKRLKGLVKEIADTENMFTVLMGDTNDFINVRDKRFDAKSLASWIKVKDLVDVAGCQQEHAFNILEPTVEKKKILAVVKGNHEGSIQHFTERDVHSNLVTYIKQKGDIKGRVGIDVGGWMILRFLRTMPGERPAGSCSIIFSLHHGFVGGKLAGAKALNMQRWLWNHECDIALHGHSHDTKIMLEGVHAVVMPGKIVSKKRIGCMTGNWLGMARYANRAGYYPCPTGYVDIKITPRATDVEERIRATAVVLA